MYRCRRNHRKIYTVPPRRRLTVPYKCKCKNYIRLFRLPTSDLKGLPLSDFNSEFLLMVRSAAIDLIASVYLLEEHYSCKAVGKGHF